MGGETRSPIWFLRNEEQHTRLDAGDHVFCGHSSEEEHRDILGAFLGEGLAQGDGVLHFVVEPLDDSDMWRVKGRRAIGPKPRLGQGGIETGERESFDAELHDSTALFDIILKETQFSRGKGHSRVRIAVDVSWPAGVEIAAWRIVEFEETLSRILLERKATALCLYDQRRCGSDLLLDVLYAHPRLLIRGRLYENGHVLWNRQAGQGPETGRLQRFLDGVVEWNRAREDAKVVRKLPQTLIDAVNEPIMIIAPNYEVRLMNREARARYGREMADVPEYCYQVSHGRERPCDGADHSCPLREVLASKGAVTVVHEHSAADGERRTVELVASPLFGENDEIVGIVESMWDVTARVRAEEDLRESEARFRSVAQTAADAVIITDVEGHVLFWNKGASQMFRYEESEMLGRDWLTLVADDAAPGARQALANSSRVLEAESGAGILSSRTDGLVGKRNGGGEFPASLSASWWRSRGSVFHGLIIRDLTEMRATQERAMVQERLAAIGQLAAGIAHDFNNILMPMVIYPELLLKDRRLSSESRGMLETIHSEALRANGLTDQILDFSRQSVMNMRSVDLAGNLREVVGLLKRTLAAKIAIRFVGDVEETFIRADQNRIHQVFLNLALNARDAMRDGGELTFSIESFQVNPDEPAPFRDMSAGAWVKVVVSDTGSGISPENLPRVFEPFFTTKEPGKGTGLGLSQVYGIVKQHGGYINMESEKGRGTDVVLYFPKIVGYSPEPTGPEATTQKGSNESILVVEDNEATLGAVCKILEGMNYTIQAARGGDEAVRILHETAVDLVICDYVMPGLSGMDLVKRVRETRPGVKVLMMSGYPLGGGTRELLEGGRVDWIQKPFGREALSAKVTESFGES